VPNFSVCFACGTELVPGGHFCPACGTAQPEAATGSLPTALIPEGWHKTDAPPLGLISSVGRCFQHYAGFQGRATRGEYWWWALFLTIMNAVVFVLYYPAFLAIFQAASQALPGTPPPLPVLTAYDSAISAFGSLLQLALFLPTLAVTVRRLHDVNKSGWAFFIGLIPLIGPILLLIWFCRRGTKGANRFGPDPFDLIPSRA
jgi:uncharacterized membrane protein YhaH (DUF805 family)